MREQLAGTFSEESAVEFSQQFVAADTSPSNRVMHEELCDAVMEAVAELSAKDREVLVMRHVEKLGTAEIAEALGMAEAGVKARLYRALIKLRARLEGHVEA
jgi:RNA polymerase sigma factor (sigma-70 family)